LEDGVKRFLRRRREDRLSQAVRLQEIDERHFVAEQVFHRREERGWTQRNLADLTGMTLAQVALVEAGQGNPPLRALVRLASALDCSLSDLATPRDTTPATSAPQVGTEETKALTGGRSGAVG
jgi:DNA-binding Xre family transcriptional regulator